MEWFRWYHGACSDIKWPVIARRAHVSVGVVVSVWAAMLEYASQNGDRGSLVGFDCETYDVLYGYEDGTCEAVMQAMTDKGVVCDACIVSWARRQPLREREEKVEAGDDMAEVRTKSTQRVREFRARQKMAQAAESETTSICNDETTMKRHETTTGNHETTMKRHETTTGNHETTMKRHETTRNNPQIQSKTKSINTRVCLTACGQACAREASSVPEIQHESDSEAEPAGNKPVAYDRQPSLAFDQFFEAYPEAHRGSRLEAEREWVALDANRALPGLPRILDALLAWEDSRTWQQQGGRYIPSAANFLKREYWQRKPQEDIPRHRGSPRATTVAQQRTQDNDEMAKLLIQTRRRKDARPEHHAALVDQYGTALSAGLPHACTVADPR